MNPDRAAVLFDQLTKTPPEGHDAEWLRFVCEILNLPACYVPAAREILRQGAWRRHTGRGQNPIGYVKTATEREGLRTRLATHRHDRTEPMVPTKDQPQKRERESRTEELRFDRVDKRRGRVPLVVPDEVTYSEHIDQLLGAGSNGMPTKTGRGTWHQGSGELADDYDYREIPGWLQRDGESDAVNWETVAQYAAGKARLVPSLAKTLRLRFEERLGRPGAMRVALSSEEAHEIEAAWKWIDRYWTTGIAPLFQLSAPPAPVGKTVARPKVRCEFIPAARTLRSVLGAHLPPPAVPEACYGRQLQTQDAMSTELDEICLRAGLRRDRIWLRWNGRRLSLSYEEFAVGIEAETISEALEALKREEVINYIARLFHPDGTAQ